MTAKSIAGIRKFIGLSTDAKPTGVTAGSEFYAYDTGITSVSYDGTNWADKPSGYPFTYEKEVDCSAGGEAQEEELITLAAGTVLIEVVTQCTEAFDGDATKTFEVGIEGNTDKYIDPVDCPVTLGAFMSMGGGTNNDKKTPWALTAAETLIATWTNHDNATAGKMKVRVVYF